MASWLMLMVSLPPNPSSLRVRVWRKLRTLGAVALRPSVYLLPPTPDNFERFSVARSGSREGWRRSHFSQRGPDRKHEAVGGRPAISEARDQDYRLLAERYRKIARGLDRKTPPHTRARRDEELARLARELDRIREIDFFDASAYQEAKRFKETIEMRLHPRAAGATSEPDIPPGSLRGRRWVTRPRPHVDRVASAWLIKRFIDPEADFVFASPKEFPVDAVPFDAAGVEFGHQGEDCTFETLLRRCGLEDQRLAQLAEIVHEIDLRDQKFARDEARGIDLALRGLLATFKDDQEVLTHGMTLFDGLYAALTDRP